jgi:hypothetical protein
MDEEENMLEEDSADNDSGFHVDRSIRPWCRDLLQESLVKGKQRLLPFRAGQMKKEFRLLDRMKLQIMAVNATGDRNIST